MGAQKGVLPSKGVVCLPSFFRLSKSYIISFHLSYVKGGLTPLDLYSVLEVLLFGLFYFLFGGD